MKITVRDAIDYLKLANGALYGEELKERLINFAKKLPHNPKGIRYVEGGLTINVADYNQGWFACVLISSDYERITVNVIDGDNLSPNPNRVKSNDEAVKLVKEYYSIQSAYDIDKYWQMTDDSRYWNEMRKLDDEADEARNEIIRKLQ
jgi:predicted DNA-binding protein (MmcQ/YjbR family)